MLVVQESRHLFAQDSSRSDRTLQQQLPYLLRQISVSSRWALKAAVKSRFVAFSIMSGNAFLI
jgi:hypothetical protein